MSPPKDANGANANGTSASTSTSTSSNTTALPYRTASARNSHSESAYSSTPTHPTHRPEHDQNPNQDEDEGEDDSSSHGSPDSDRHSRSSSLIRRSIHAVAELFHPFSASALATLPKLSRPLRYHRRDAVPETEPDEEGNLPTVRDYHAINSVPPQVRVPKKVPTPVKVEAKVWFANERTWIAWLNNAVLLATLSVALFNASKDEISRRFAYTYALISIGVLLYAYILYQHRLTMILRRDPGHFDAHIGPIILSISLFTAILANFIIRVRQLHEKGTPFPGTGFLFSEPPSPTFSLPVTTATPAFAVQFP
ncbi:hypothetical protein AX17_006616 [Amanita inopinata Kibby_2008]|nr:hypothetical protein AX17_006616 [Amanita inopinata Kibby_2008]